MAIKYVEDHRINPADNSLRSDTQTIQTAIDGRGCTIVGSDAFNEIEKR